jgi:transcriptional regulator with XRE-family HTH domain
MITKESLGRAIAEYREKSGQSQLDLSRHSDISVHTLRSWEQGKAYPGTPGLLRLSIALNLGTLELFARASEIALEPAQ